MKLCLALALSALAFAACSGRRLPPGTPPPEYEAPIVTPWPAASADAGVDAAPKASEDEPPSPATPAPELSLDAGPR